MASNPPGTCCTIGVVHEGNSEGEIKEVDGTPAYFAHTKDGSTDNAVLILTDVYGHTHINVQLIADQFAANGYFTVIPDLFQGDPLPQPSDRPADFDLWAWFRRPPAKDKEAVDPVVAKVIKEMRQQYGVKKIGAVGYCFGAKYVCRFLGDVGSHSNAMVDAGYTAHPSFVDEEELEAITGPLSIAAAETDDIFSTEKRHKSEEILAKLSDGKNAIPYEITLYGGTEHGFAVRADLSHKRAKFAKEKAFQQAVNWFNHHLAGTDLD